MTSARRITTAVVLVFLALACDSLTSPGAGDEGYTPTWITASWNFGSTILSDRRDREAVNFTDPICPASALSIRPQTDRLGFVWTCTQDTWIYVCATEGQATQPSSGFPRCAQDALDTPVSQLRPVFVENDGLQVIVPSTSLRSVQIFYCGSQTTPSGTPLTCQ